MLKFLLLGAVVLIAIWWAYVHEESRDWVPDEDALADSEPEDDTDIDCSQESLPEVLLEITHLFAHRFTAQEAETLRVRAFAAKVDSEFEVAYQVPWQGGIVTLRIAVFRDDLDAIRLTFRGPRSLIGQLETRLDRFFVEG